MESATISTIHWLTALLEAGDDEAAAWQKLLDWTGTWLHPRESWFKCVADFPHDLRELCLTSTSDDDLIKRRDLFNFTVPRVNRIKGGLARVVV